MISKPKRNEFELTNCCFPFVADVLSGSTSSSVHHTGVLEEWAGGQTWWNSRIFVMLATLLFVLAPLVSFRHIGKLALKEHTIFFVVVFAGLT